jgi:histidinol-phosphate aminotransferase
MVAQKRKKTARRDNKKTSPRPIEQVPTGSLAQKIARISKLDRYTRPAKIRSAAKLDSNENFVLGSDFILSRVIEAAKSADLREYPIDELEILYDRLQAYTGIDKQYISAGSGSDQIIELLLSTIQPKRATVSTPTFSYFVNRCELHQIKVDKVPLNRSDFTVEYDRFLASAKKSDLVYICSPNNPTGNQLKHSTVSDIIDSLKKDTLVLVDEAYAEFADYSFMHDATKRSNVAVLRTLSKAFGLAGARVGYMVSNANFADVFRSTIQSPYPISTLSLMAASAVLADAGTVLDAIKQIRNERTRMTERLAALGKIQVFSSDANFIFISAGRRYYEAIANRLAAESIIVKMFENIAGYEGCFRITIGPRELNDRVLRCIEQGAEAD